ncbi:putative receptor-like protein kinase At3g47110 isoform X2 [Punica granatum]|uniref:Receptor-like protein kinase At3g47110 isoform X2 n=1 Tax=Punica granatum TaxID=22663 RepID=A0A6P8CTX2_PUNGR|nr:putative receptor-like protein kinase At3g47110 isoform X2 [Punica granatum]
MSAERGYTEAIRSSLQGDFGLVRFMPGAARELISVLTSSIGVKESPGYIAPDEFLSVQSTERRLRCQLMEMFTGKRPADDMFSDGLNLHLFAKAAFPE